MDHHITVHYDRPLIRKALNHFFIKRLGRLMLLAFGFFFLLFISKIITGTWDTFSLWLAAFMGVACGLLVWVYFVRLRQSETFLSKMKTPTVRFIFSDDGVATESDLGSSKLKWETFDEVLCFDTVWLLVYARSAYLTLPVTSLNEEIRALLRSKVKS